MKAYLALTRNELRLAVRDKQVLFFNYMFPLIFFFLLATMLHAERGSAIAMIVTVVRPSRSATSPATTHPAPPDPTTAKAARLAAAGSLVPAAAKLAARKSGTQVHIA